MVLRFQRLVPLNGRGVVLGHLQRLIAAYLPGPILVHGELLVPAHALRLVVLDRDVQVPLRVQVYLFRVLLILEPQLVRALASRAGCRTERAPGLLVRELHRRRVHPVVDRSGDERPIGIALQELHHHLLADARQIERPPPRTRPALAHPDPAGAPLVPLPLPVPMELRLHPPVLVGEDLLARRPHHHRGLRPGNDRPLRSPFRPEGHVASYTGEVVAVALGLRFQALGAMGQHLRLLSLVANRDQQVLPVHALARMLVQLEDVPGQKPPR